MPQAKPNLRKTYTNYKYRITSPHIGTNHKTMAKQKKPAENPFNRTNQLLPDNIWADINQNILEDGLEGTIGDYKDMETGKISLPDDIVLQAKIQKAADALKEVEDYLEIEKFDENKCIELGLLSY
jgi:hypothetical protein